MVEFAGGEQFQQLGHGHGHDDGPSGGRPTIGGDEPRSRWQCGQCQDGGPGAHIELRSEMLGYSPHATNGRIADVGTAVPVGGVGVDTTHGQGRFVIQFSAARRKAGSRIPKCCAP